VPLASERGGEDQPLTWIVAAVTLAPRLLLFEPVVLRRLALALALLPGASSVVHAGEPHARIDAVMKQRGAKHLGSGWTANAWLSADGKTFYKRIKPIIAEGDLMTTPNAAKRRAFVEHTVWVIDQLRSAPEFAKYRDLLPRTRTQGRFGVVQDAAHGIEIGELTGAAHALAAQTIEDVKHAAQWSLPGVEIDVNPGNILFAKDGHPVKYGFFDPAGGWWARTWTKANPATRDRQGGSWALITRKLSQDQRAWKRDADIKPIGDSFAFRVDGGDLQFGDAIVVANLERKDAFVVKHGFKQVYESNTQPDSHGRLIAKVLGAPMDEEHADTRSGALPGQVIQRFERGYLTWDPQRGVRVRLPAFAEDIPK